MAQQPDVLILGGGVIGLTTAYHLSQAGARVALADRSDLGLESSWAGAGIIPASPSPARAGTPLEMLAAHSAVLHPRMAQHLRDETGVDNGYRVCGGWEVFGPHDHVPVLHWERQGIDHQQADAALLAEREPALRVEPDWTFHLPATAQVRNPRHVKALIAWCGRAGVVFHRGCPVLGFDREGERIVGVQTSMGRLEAGKYLIAAGAWSEPILRPLGVRSAVRPVRGQIVLLHCSPPLLRGIVESGKRYIVPRPDGRVLIGSTEENVGYIKETTATGVRDLLDFALKLVPDLGGAPLERSWAGLRPGSPDGAPFLGRVPGLDNLFLAAGHHRAGIQLSPATGLVMKELLLGEPTTIPLDAFRVDRET